ncbi:UNVERIFIED_CONTAM: hypothetical protein GTU68_029829 [Idotea baltica]|nr:hypothetical protein [Idotea baltica]
MKHFVSLAEQYETIVCIVDLHALTSVESREDLEEYSRSLAAAYLSIGLDPKKTIIFRQSDVPEVCELTWYLACQFPLGLLERGHLVKDARAKGVALNSGKMIYPILMAADILLYKGTLVPVGADQKQHLEMAREVAEKVNYRFGDIFPLPEPYISEETGVIPGLDGRKMSKSYDNFIGLFEEPKKARKKIMKIVTDSKTVEEVKDPDNCSVFQLFSLLGTKEEATALAARYRSGGMGYGEAKQALFDVYEREVAPIRDVYNSLMQRPEHLVEVLSDGAARARVIAKETMDEMRTSLGIGKKL